MAVAAAEQQTFQAYENDMNLDELRGYERPPEREVYGRSLSTIYRLGAYMVGKVAAETIQSPEADQVRVEFYTSVEEGFGTDMELGGGFEVRDFDTRPILDGKTMSKDLKTAVSDMTLAGLVCAAEKADVEIANGDERFMPQLIRTEWDHKNALLVDQMAQGETDYNTRIVVSPFPEEAAARSGDAYWRNIGYVPHLRRGFVQVYHVDGDGGEVLAGSLSFDGSNKESLREVFAHRGIDIPASEVTDNWLQYAITGSFTKDEAQVLGIEIANEAGDPAYKKTTNTIDVTRKHRPIMDRVFDESYVHACESLARGCQTDGVQKLIGQLANQATGFNDHFQQALYTMRANKDQFTDEDMAVVHDLLVYSTVEMMRALHLQGVRVATNTTGAYIPSGLSALHHELLHARSPEMLQQALGNFAAEGASNNRVISACGLSISVGGANGSADPNNPQAAFGGFGSGEDKFGKLTFTCPKGHHNRRPYGKLINACQHDGCKAKVTC